MTVGQYPEIPVNALLHAALANREDAPLYQELKWMTRGYFLEVQY